MNLYFFVLPVDSEVKNEKGGNIYLVEDNWNDWWEYRILYQMYYKDLNEEVYYIGSLKIGEIGMEENQDKINIPKYFDSLSDDFFSVGQDCYYYENLNRLGDEFRDNLLNKLNDISLDLELFSKVSSLKVTIRSVLRDISEETVKNEYNRLARGYSDLTKYDFNFVFPGFREGHTKYELRFTSEPDSNPPTNVQAIIGRNGVGKTHLLNQMVASLIGSKEEKQKNGEFQILSWSKENRLFDNIIYLSFSAFDEARFFEPKKNIINGIGYTYIGLKTYRSQSEKTGIVETKSSEQLRTEFIESMWNCRMIPSKKARLEQAIEMLSSDPIFAISGVSDLLKITSEEENMSENSKIEKRQINEAEKQYLKEKFFETALPISKRFSSGHSIVLLTITKLIEELEEKTLVFLDEPESHLHPPLLSTFTRILSNLLVNRNGIGIIATHSPVILQEIPSKCVWIADRFGTDFMFNRPEIETFGENINTLTKKVFSFEITDSGFHKLLKEVANKVDSYDAAIQYFNNELGMEAKTILRALMQLKENNWDA